MAEFQITGFALADRDCGHELVEDSAFSEVAIGDLPLYHQDEGHCHGN